MPSQALTTWQTVRAQTLAEITSAHRQVGGSGRGRRYATAQLNSAYAILLLGQFQAFCRDLHTETSLHLVATIQPTTAQPAILELLVSRRRLDAGNPNADGLAADFGRFGLNLWQVLKADPRFKDALQANLKLLCTWRNALAHQDFTSAELRGRSKLNLGEVKALHRGINRLAILIEEVVRSHLTKLLSRPPW